MGNDTANLDKLGYKKPVESDFEAVQEAVPTEAHLKDGEVLLRHQVLSVDPYVAAYCMGADNVGKPVVATAAGVVLVSKSPMFSPGDSAVGVCGASEYSVMADDKLRKISTDADSTVPFDVCKLPISLSLGLLGMPGATAYFAVKDNLGADLSGQTVVMSGSAGCVGSAASQICKLFGAARVVGVAGSDEKCARCLEKYGYDAMVNYKTADDVAAELAKACPGGVDAYFDNVGGATARAVKALMKDGGVVSKVGSIGGDGADAIHDPRLQVKGFY